MEPHNETAVAEAPPENASPAVEDLPNANPEEPASFSDALEQALQNLENPQPEPTPEPTPEVQEVQPEEVVEPTDNPPLADKQNLLRVGNQPLTRAMDVGLDFITGRMTHDADLHRFVIRCQKLDARRGIAFADQNRKKLPVFLYLFKHRSAFRIRL